MRIFPMNICKIVTTSVSRINNAIVKETGALFDNKKFGGHC